MPSSPRSTPLISKGLRPRGAGVISPATGGTLTAPACAPAPRAPSREGPTAVSPRRVPPGRRERAARRRCARDRAPQARRAPPRAPRHGRSGGRPRSASASRGGSRDAHCRSQAASPPRCSAPPRRCADRAPDRSNPRAGARALPRRWPQGSFAQSLAPCSGYARCVSEQATIERAWQSASEAEYAALTEGAGLIGPGAAEFLQGQVTNDVLALAPGEGCYAAFLTAKGKMLGDLRVLATGSDELLLDCERVALQALFDMIRRHRIGYAFELHKRTLQCALLTLAGPSARALAAASAAGALPAQREHAHLAASIAGAPVRLIAGPRGDIDVLTAAADAERVREALLEAGALTVTESAYEVLRIERGIPRFGIDMDGGTIPQEAGINERAVSFTKGCYVGQETVARLFYKGRPNRRLLGLRSRTPLPGGAAVLIEGRTVGHVGSSCLSPAQGPLALAMLRRECEPGAEVLVEAGAPEHPAESGPAELLPATVAALPLG